MVLTVTLSPCIDKTATCESFDPNAVNRIKVVAKDFGGKGINVSRALKRLGVETYAFGIGYDANMKIEDFLHAEGIDSWFIPVVGELRTNLKLFDKATGKTVEINEPALPIVIETVATAIAIFAENLTAADIVVLAGSVPTGTPDDIYKRFVRMTEKRRPTAKVIVDCSGQLLLKALEAKPYMIKPNLNELADTFGLSHDDRDGILDKARELIRRGSTQVVLLSDGANGAYILTADEEHFLPSIKVDAKSAQGAGDGMVAGACKAICEGKKPIDILRYGIAAATGAVTKQGTSFCEMAEFEGYLEALKM